MPAQIPGPPRPLGSRPARNSDCGSASSNTCGRSPDIMSSRHGRLCSTRSSPAFRRHNAVNCQVQFELTHLSPYLFQESLFCRAIRSGVRVTLEGKRKVGTLDRADWPGNLATVRSLATSECQEEERPASPIRFPRGPDGNGRKKWKHQFSPR